MNTLKSLFIVSDDLRFVLTASASAGALVLMDTRKFLRILKSTEQWVNEVPIKTDVRPVGYTLAWLKDEPSRPPLGVVANGVEFELFVGLPGGIPKWVVGNSLKDLPAEIVDRTKMNSLRATGAVDSVFKQADYPGWTMKTAASNQSDILVRLLQNGKKLARSCDKLVMVDATQNAISGDFWLFLTSADLESRVDAIPTEEATLKFTADCQLQASSAADPAANLPTGTIVKDAGVPMLAIGAGLLAAIALGGALYVAVTAGDNKKE